MARTFVDITSWSWLTRPRRTCLNLERATWGDRRVHFEWRMQYLPSALLARYLPNCIHTRRIMESAEHTGTTLFTEYLFDLDADPLKQVLGLETPCLHQHTSASHSHLPLSSREDHCAEG